MLNCFKSLFPSRSSWESTKISKPPRNSKHPKPSPPPYDPRQIKHNPPKTKTKPTTSSEISASKLTPNQISSLAHWSMYGQPGAPPAKRVRKPDWGNIKPFKSPQSAAWNVRLGKGDLERLLLGFSPREMEDKWVVYAEGPDWDERDGEGRVIVKFHRSWTGSLIAEMEVRVRRGEKGRERWRGKGGKGGKGMMGEARVTRIAWEESEDVVRNQREEDAKKTLREVCRWVLGVELPPDGAT